MTNTTGRAVVGRDERPSNIGLRQSVTRPSDDVNWPEVMTRTQASKYLGVCIDFLNKHREVPRVRIGGTTRYLKASLIEFLQSREVRR